MADTDTKPKEYATELEYLRWFARNADFGPASGDVVDYMREAFTAKTGKAVPKEWDREDEGDV